MDITKMLVELHEELDRIDEAILMFSRLAAGAPKRRGRPPKLLVSAGPKRRGRPPGSRMSAATRQAASERMKKYWAAKRKAKT